MISAQKTSSLLNCTFPKEFRVRCNADKKYKIYPADFDEYIEKNICKIKTFLPKKHALESSYLRNLDQS